MTLKRTAPLLASSALLAVAPVASAQATNEVRVLTFNLRYASASDGDNNWVNPNQSPERRQVALQVITQRLPDLIGFQEGEDTQLDDLAANLPGYAFERRKPSGGSGIENAAMAWNTNRLELLDRGVFSLGPAPGGGYWNNPPGTPFDPYQFFPDMRWNFPRLAMWGRFRWKPTGQELLFYTTHFDLNEGPQVSSAALIVDDAKTRNARMPLSPLAIVVGDFNSSQANRAWQLFTGSLSTNGITGDFTDSWQQVRGSWANSGTFHGFNGGTIPESDRIDWILHRGGFTALQCQIVTDAAAATNLSNGATRTQYPSDHYPVFAVLRLPPPAADYDRDGLPDSRELNSPASLPADPDTDNDLLLDGQEDLDGDGTVGGGETHPAQPGDTQNPTDIRSYQMDGIRDHTSLLLASNGLALNACFDGRYLYASTFDAGEGNDHFVFVSTNPAGSVSAPWAKSGNVAPWIAFLADEDGGSFKSWFNAAGSMITNPLSARAATYFQNNGRLEGVLDLAALLGPGFTTPIYLAAAPYATADGGALYAPAQVPAGNGDGHLVGVGEFVRIDPGDLDGDGINDFADPDRDGDGLPDAWELAWWNGLGSDADDDPDGDGADNQEEWLACTRPNDSHSVFRVQTLFYADGAAALVWPVIHGKTSVLSVARGPTYVGAPAWSNLATAANLSVFPVRTAGYTNPLAGSPLVTVFRLSGSP